MALLDGQRRSLMPLALVALLALCSLGCSRAAGGAYVPGAGVRNPLDGSNVIADIEVDAVGPVTAPLALPTKCPMKDKKCLKLCMDDKCSSFETNCEADPACKAVSSCVKSQCQWRAFECINQCIYKRHGKAAGKAYLAMMGCAVDQCVAQQCGDGYCLGDESPVSCPSDCRYGQAGAGSCASRCGTYIQGAACQCDTVCTTVGDCCADEGLVCDVPDIALLSVSGHNVDLFGPKSEVRSRNYLREPGNIVEAVVDDLQARGLDVYQQGFIDSFYSYDDDKDGLIDRFGFSRLLMVLRWIDTHWVKQAKKPPKLLIIAHSHGAVWAHLALMCVPELKVDVLVSLDGSCLLWEGKHAGNVIDYVNQFGDVFGVPVWDPCDKWKIPGQSKLRDAEDVTPDNVVLNLEVRALKGFPNDEQSNVRLDGSSAGIKTFAHPDISHKNADQAGSISVNWVLSELAASEFWK